MTKIEADPVVASACPNVKPKRVRTYTPEQVARRVALGKIWAAKNPEKIAGYSKKWRETNIEAAKATERRYYEANRDKVRARKAKYDQEHRAQVTARKARWRKANAEKVKAINAASREKHRERHKQERAAKRTAWIANNQDVIAAKKRRSEELREARRLRVNLKNKEWRKNNPDEAKKRDARNRRPEYGARHYAANKDKIRAKHTAWYERNKESVIRRSTKWRKAHPEHVANKVTLRRAAVRKAAVGDQKALKAWIRGWRAKPKVTCFWCRGSFRGKDCHPDHITPLAKGGSHALENLCVSCAKCNHEKHAKTLDQWNQRITEPVLF